MALKTPREILWKWHLRYLIIEMRFKTSERPGYWQLPWGYLLQLRDGLDSNACLQGPASSATRQDIGQKTAFHLAHCQDPVHNGQNGHWKDDCPSLSLQGKSVSHSHNQQSEVLTDLLVLAAEDWCSPGILAPFKITLEEPRVTVQVAGMPQTPTWCYQTSWVSFILHRSPW
jgi:hypothetical protein